MKVLEYRFIVHQLNKCESQIEWNSKFNVPDRFNRRLVITLNEKVSRLISTFLAELPPEFLDELDQNQRCQ